MTERASRTGNTQGAAVPRAPLADAALDQLFRDARTFNKFLPREVADCLLHEIVDLMKLGPTSANCSPARILFAKSAEAKERLKPHLSEGNRDKTMQAPVCAIIGYDLEFYHHLPRLFPHTNAKSWFEGKEEKIRETAFRNGTLQAAYLFMAARALGLDCGPMTGFDPNGVDKEFFAGTAVRSNILCNLGYGEADSLRPRSPRFAFDEIGEII